MSSCIVLTLLPLMLIYSFKASLTDELRLTLRRWGYLLGYLQKSYFTKLYSVRAYVLNSSEADAPIYKNPPVNKIAERVFYF